ncbi:MAG: SprT-like domain-containing protein [Candidatus Woesearchaeota archaeon]|nr:SprT-like domain-containing protein [Candidatus Woesearchaeota archaeon]
MHHIVQKAYIELFQKEPDFDANIKYSRAFKGFNANVRYTREVMHFRLSYQWKEISDDIKIGLIQSLLNKVFRSDKKTMNQELYEIFLKKVPTFSKKLESDPILEDSFNRMNELYFQGIFLKPNLVFGGNNFRTLGTYNYNDDTIMISSVLRKDQNLMDYVMYHEMLHMKFRYKKTGKRVVHHSKEFREWESRYHDKDVESKLKQFLRKERFLDIWF